MKFICLVSGGKDSIYTIQLLKNQGHIPVALIYMKNNENYVDSYMFQTVGSEVVELFGKCMSLPLFIYQTKCISKNINLEYSAESTDEVEDLFLALSDLRKKFDFEGVSSGAILSTYQKNRVENIAKRLNLKSLAPLWKRNQKELLKEMIQNNINAVLVKIACPLLKTECLVKNLKNVLSLDMGLDENYCGEGGEYETVVLDCDLFTKRIVYDSYTISCHPDETYENSTVFYVTFSGLNLQQK